MVRAAAGAVNCGTSSAMDFCHDWASAVMLSAARGVLRETPLLPTRPIAAGATLLATAGALFAFLFSAQEPRAQGSAGACDDAGIAVLPSPIVPWRGAPLRV